VKGIRLLGLAAAGLVIVLDQISKPLMRDWLSGGDIALTSFLSLVSAWNRGVGFSLLTMNLPSGPYILSALALTIAAVMLVWLFRVARAISALALGLIIGGAIGNAIDRLAYGAVVDFVLFHITTPTFNFTWYVFNLADAAIVAGVIGLLYESFLGGGVPQKRPDPP